MSFATNLLNHYRLTEGLIERGLLAKDAIVINMSSGGMYNVPLKIARLNMLDPEHYDGVWPTPSRSAPRSYSMRWWRRRYADRDCAST